MFPTILEMRLEQATLFKNVLEAISDDMFSEAYFEFSGTGFKLQAKDSSSIALVALLLRAEAFNHYRCDRARFSMGLNLADMAKAFRCASNDEIITIKAEDDWSDRVTFRFESPADNGQIICDYDLEFDGEPLEIKEFQESEYQAVVRMPSALFIDICKKLSCFGDRDSVDISVDKDCVKFFNRGKSGTSSIVCRQTQTVDKPKEPTLIEIEMKEQVEVKFDLRCMNSFSKASTLSDQVTIRLSSKRPAMFEYKIAEMGYIRYYLAPRISKEDKMHNEGDDTAKEDKMQMLGDEMQN